AAGLVDRSGDSTLGVIANSPGSWANDVAVSVRAATAGPGAFKLVVLEGGLPVESFDDLSMDSESDDFVDAAINSRSQFIRVKAGVPDQVDPADAIPRGAPVLRLRGDGDRPYLPLTDTP